MKIVEATPKPSKGEEIIRAFEALICAAGDKAAKIDSESDLRRFRKHAKSRGYNVTAQKQDAGGWLVWIFTR